MAIYAENTDIDTTHLCKFEARKGKVLQMAMMLETVAWIKKSINKKSMNIYT